MLHQVALVKIFHVPQFYVTYSAEQNWLESWSCEPTVGARARLSQLVTDTYALQADLITALSFTASSSPQNKKKAKIEASRKAPSSRSGVAPAATRFFAALLQTSSAFRAQLGYDCICKTAFSLFSLSLSRPLSLLSHSVERQTDRQTDRETGSSYNNR